MIPKPRQPRSEHMTLLASALCTRTIADSMPITLNSGFVVLAIRLEGHRYDKPRIVMPRNTFVSTWNLLLGREFGFISANTQIRSDRAEELRQEIKGRGCVIRVQVHEDRRKDEPQTLWSHEVMEVYP